MCAENIKMKSRKLAFFTMLLIAAASVTVAVSVMVSEDAFAKDGRYSGDSTSQAAAVNNECLNPIFDSNSIDNAVGVGNCAGTVSQQDESGSASAPITHQSANPTIELQRSTTTQPGLGAPTCEECFDSLTATQLSQFEESLSPTFPSVTTIEELCDFLESNSQDPAAPGVEEVEAILQGIGPPPLSLQTIDAIVKCLLESGP
jgi:hypothetical protein